jgi:hypothetical protein
MSLITQPRIVHVQPSQPLARNLGSPATPSPDLGSPLTPSMAADSDSPVGGRDIERVSLIDVRRSDMETSSPSPTSGVRGSARASLPSGLVPPTRPSGPRSMTSDLQPNFNLSAEQTEASEKAIFFDMKVEQILGPRDEKPTHRKEERMSRLGLQDVRKMIGDIKEAKGTIRGQKMGLKGKGERLWQMDNIYSMSGETLGEGSGTRLDTPDRLAGFDRDASSSQSREDRKASCRGVLGMGWWKQCLGCRMR